jgi:hypothetical protein
LSFCGKKYSLLDNWDRDFGPILATFHRTFSCDSFKCKDAHTILGEPETIGGMKFQLATSLICNHLTIE